MNLQNLNKHFSTLVVLALLTSAAYAEDAERYPVEYFALRAAVTTVTVSPSGKQLAMLKILSREGNPFLHVYNADDLAEKPYVVGSDKMEITAYNWADEDHIVVTFRQKTTDRLKGREQDVYKTKIAILDLKNNEFEDFDSPQPLFENRLSAKPGKIIISERPGAEEDLSLKSAFRPRAYYEMDLKTGRKKLLIRGQLEVGQIGFDAKGNPRHARGIDSATRDQVYYFRDTGQKGWKEIYRISDADWGGWHGSGVLWDDPAVPGNVLVLAHEGDDKVGLWSYNTNTMKFDELLYRRNDVDVGGIIYHSNYWENPNKPVAVWYYKDNYHFEYFDETEGAVHKQLEQLIPGAFYVNIASRSIDGNTMIIMNRGPQDPGTYYLYRNNELIEVGTQQPLLDKEQLADVKYISYKARDGRKIPAFVTVPKVGKKPFPLVVLPHGGPHVRETVFYDEWAQFLANRGYMVIQPQYRMSLNYGMDHFQSAFMKGSQAGRQMQDDKDDGALFLVEKGFADPDRMAMFGWSYGGYAALVAASRTPQIYKCVIAGAAVSNQRRQANDFLNRADGTGKIWREVYQYGAIQPTEEASKVNVPVLLIHGSVDHRVLPRQAAMYRKELDKFDKPYKYVELEGAGHFSNTLFYNHQLELYTSIEDFLANDCGPNGIARELSASTSD
jgi:dipeptidyl aminopeptidase/acylaminoacyl peptidase